MNYVAFELSERVCTADMVTVTVCNAIKITFTLLLDNDHMGNIQNTKTSLELGTQKSFFSPLDL